MDKIQRKCCWIQWFAVVVSSAGHLGDGDFVSHSTENVDSGISSGFRVILGFTESQFQGGTRTELPQPSGDVQTHLPSSCSSVHGNNNIPSVLPVLGVTKGGMGSD